MNREFENFRMEQMRCLRLVIIKKPGRKVYGFPIN